MMPKKKITKKKIEPKNKLSLATPPFTIQQLEFIIGNTPKEYVFRRPGRGGKAFEYVPGWYIKKRLNFIFAWGWSFEIKSQEEKYNQVITNGRLIIQKKDGSPLIWKEDTGRADLKFKKGEKKPMDYGNDCKASVTDCIKRCAYQLGIASDIYSGNENAEIQKIDRGYIAPPITAIPIKAEVINPAKDKIVELMNMLDGKTEKQKLADLKKKLGIILPSFRITQKHSSILIVSLLNNKATKK